MLLIVLAVVGVLYIQHTISFLTMRARAQGEQAYVHRLVQDNHRLEREQHALEQPQTILAQARALGMVRAGERPYVVSGLPGR